MKSFLNYKVQNKELAPFGVIDMLRNLSCKSSNHEVKSTDRFEFDLFSVRVLKNTFFIRLR